MILPATSSITSVQKLAIKTTILALITSFCIPQPLNSEFGSFHRSLVRNSKTYPIEVQGFFKYRSVAPGQEPVTDYGQQTIKLFTFVFWWPFLEEGANPLLGVSGMSHPCNGLALKFHLRLQCLGPASV